MSDSRLIARSILTAVAHGTSWDEALDGLEPDLDLTDVALELLALSTAVLHTCSDTTGLVPAVLLQRAVLWLEQQQPPTR